MVQVTGEPDKRVYQARRVTVLVENLADLELVRGLVTYLRSDAPRSVVWLAYELHEAACADAPPAGHTLREVSVARAYGNGFDKGQDAVRIGPPLPGDKNA